MEITSQLIKRHPSRRDRIDGTTGIISMSGTSTKLRLTGTLESLLPASKNVSKFLKEGCTVPSQFTAHSSLIGKMCACTRIRALRERQTRREAGAQSLTGPPSQ